MKICVFGLWHLGTVTAACLAAGGHDVVGLDPDRRVVDELSRGVPPLFEPGLADLVQDGLSRGRLRFSCDLAQAGDADVVWIAIDTPVDEDDRADVDAVVRGVSALFPHFRDRSLVLISSQVPVGTTRRVAELFARGGGGRGVAFAYSPENLRLGKAIERFTRPDRIVVGTVGDMDRDTVTALLRPFSDRLLWMSAESAEMTKHALNAFLATSVTFINEIAAVCEQVGADAADVERGLKTDARIGPAAYLSPGAAFAGGTLARDVMFLSRIGGEHRVSTHLLSAVKSSNDAHREWPQRRLRDLLGDLTGTTIAVWGLTYKPGTNTLRRSSAVELCRWLHGQGVRVRAHDPAISALAPEFASAIDFVRDPLEAVRGTAALVVATAWPEYRDIPAQQVAARMAGSLVLDANRFLCGTLGEQPGLRYVSVGVSGAVPA